MSIKYFVTAGGRSKCIKGVKVHMVNDGLRISHVGVWKKRLLVAYGGAGGRLPACPPESNPAHSSTSPPLGFVQSALLWHTLWQLFVSIQTETMTLALC